jgi:hypothetical protein
MSLSTMSLGRFMRDMFGDVQEPWLEAGRMDLPAQRREQTISSTNASGGQQPPFVDPPLPHELAPLHLSPGMLGPPEELPHHYIPPAYAAHAAHEAHEAARSQAELSARSSSPAQPGWYGTAAPGPEVVRDAHLSSPDLPPMLPQIPAEVARAMGMPIGSQPIPSFQFAVQSVRVRSGACWGPARRAADRKNAAGLQRRARHRSERERISAVPAAA